VLTIHSLPDLRTPTFLCGLSGWPDAGSAASGAIEYLIMKWAPRRFAEIDPGAIYLQTNQRPVSRRDRSGERHLRWPRLAFYALPVPHAPTDLVLVLGPEPDLRWRTCAEAAMGLAERLGAGLVVTLGAFLAPVPHGGPVSLSGRSSRPDLERKLLKMGIREGTYQGPTGFPTVLLDRAARRGLDAASIWAASPIYLRGLPNPKLAAALLGTVERLLQVDVGLAELEVAGRDLERRIDQELRERPDLERFIERLAGLEEEEEEPAGELPSAEEVLADLERYLRRLRGGDQPA
jgi:proteasome assembly chaperone (PAC2) family protein